MRKKEKLDAHGVAGDEGASSCVVHGQRGVEHLVLVEQGHRVERVRSKQKPRVLQHRGLGKPSGAAGVDVQHRVVVAGGLRRGGRGVGGDLLGEDWHVRQVR